MIIHKEIALEDFEGWCGAEDTISRVYEAGKIRTLEAILEDLYPDGIDETDLNDLLRFESETVYGWLDMKTDDEIEKEEEERTNKLELIALLMSQDISADRFCEHWCDDLEQDCMTCPLSNCDDDEAMIRDHDTVLAALEKLKKELEDEE